MADIELVIKIPKKVYKAIYDKNALGCDIGDIKNIIRNGIPLPKGHGDLIDVSSLLTVTDIRSDGSEITYVPYLEIEDTPTIIGADKESEE